MTNYIFAEAPRQDAVITFAELGNRELQLLKSVANWDSPNEWRRFIFDANGRGVLFKSPDRDSTLEDLIGGNYDGLQIIGAGGNLIYVQNGNAKPFILPATISINSPDRTNHANELKCITELREVNDRGLFEFSHRAYVPLHGMDISEARNRKNFTAFLNDAIADYRERNFRLTFVAPKLAAEGHFPGLLDNQGNPLHFQVYRVPRLSRLPRQTMDFLHHSTDILAMEGLLKRASYLMGCSLRTFHNFDLAYMDGHPGNLSFIIANGNTTLYTTDLGSMKELSQKKFTERYKALDLYQYLAVSASSIANLLSYEGYGSPEAVGRITFIMMLRVANRTFEGYFNPEIKSGAFTQPYVNFISREFLSLALNGRLQTFAEAFEKLNVPKRVNIYQIK